MRACSIATNITPLKFNSDLCCLLFSLFLRLISAEWLPVLSVLLALGAYSCFSKPTLSDCLQYILKLFWLTEELVMAEKNPFSPNHCQALHFLLLETDQKRGGKASSPKLFCKTALLPPSGQAICEDQLTSEMQQLLNTCQQNLQSPGRSMPMSLGQLLYVHLKCN